MKNSLSKLLTLIGGLLFMTVFAAADIAPGFAIITSGGFIILIVAIAAVIAALIVMLINKFDKK